MPDEADDAQANLEAEAEFQRMQREAQERLRLQNRRTTCIDCGDDLHPVRMLIFALRCVDCQMAYERKQREGKHW